MVLIYAASREASVTERFIEVEHPNNQILASAGPKRAMMYAIAQRNQPIDGQGGCWRGTAFVSSICRWNGRIMGRQWSGIAMRMS